MFEKIVYPVLEDGEEARKVERTEEEIEAEDYVLNKVLVRPSINVFFILKYLFMFLFAVFGLTCFLFLLSKRFLGDVMNSFLGELENRPENVFFFFCVISFFIMFSCFLKLFLIGIIHLYQRFSPEEKRRSCLFKPTCSEYAILALNKYGVIRGIPRILDRFRRCHGSKYHIDYP
ncbi:membrane protein insertion efficiency factor YidD [uncultured Fibrobacter sp.]|uniref:membrane protein insertion efficiency factor YidD n=1 Tax=uncultured Fibrobacter sp. TaxID=261512 RepID=UPI00280381AE|nr:membrane protein insertion efficiency factor YidD [uncultured Fibrobacter sp.]